MVSYRFDNYAFGINFDYPDIFNQPLKCTCTWALKHMYHNLKNFKKNNTISIDIPYIRFFPHASIFHYVRENIKIVKNSIA